ncbi:hypothetical protein QTP70_033313 [Hemibagrus guttatus]|uniref:Endonuclease/exonuclease/phosphatase domain-containing protein n=1 Tax=Hemibagrus guttatus TaxID=175788 RepID=A0AAE0UUE8_9TELE|nr:hypothetical protein QTP70_033313 [Hemibagrus guttatus]
MPQPQPLDAVPVPSPEKWEGCGRKGIRHKTCAKLLCGPYKRHLSTTSNSQTPNSTMAKTKELSKDTRNQIVDLHQALKTESAIVCELDKKERFWSELDEVMENIPTGERVVIGADFNRHVSEGNTGDEEVMGKFGVRERKLERQRMDMAVVNTYFQKKSGEVEAGSGFGQVVLPDNWETAAEVIRETWRKVLGVSSGRRKEDKETWWWNEEVQDSVQRKRLAKKKWDMDRTEENRQEYKELQHRGGGREVSKAKQKAYDELYTRLDTREGEKDLYRLARQRDRDGSSSGIFN